MIKLNSFAGTQQEDYYVNAVTKLFKNRCIKREGIIVRKKIVIGTRSSKLALWQAEYVADRLRKQYEGLEVELMHIVTKRR